MAFLCKLEKRQQCMVRTKFLPNILTLWVERNNVTDDRHRQTAHASPVSGIISMIIPSASPVLSRRTSSFTCQLISVIITILVIHHSFTPGSKPTFSSSFPVPTSILLHPFRFGSKLFWRFGRSHRAFHWHPYQYSRPNSTIPKSKPRSKKRDPVWLNDKCMNSIRSRKKLLEK